MTTKTDQGRRTRHGILDVAARLASIEGLEGLTLGRLATELEMSKSGLFAHFGSKEELQLATIAHARDIYSVHVIVPGLSAPRGLARLYGLCDRYLRLMERAVFPGGCFFASAMAEFDARPGAVRDRVAAVQREWLDALERTARDGVEQGELDRSTDAVQLAFELEAAMLSANWYHHLYSDTGFFGRARKAVHATLRSAATGKGMRALEAAMAAAGSE